jgi:hypothetical protein
VDCWLYQLSGWAERAIIYSVAEVLEARFSKSEWTAGFISCQAGRRGVIIYPLAEVLEARFSKPGGEGAPADLRGLAQSLFCFQRR